MPTSPVPALDPIPLPGPGWLFHILWVLTFFLHLVFVNAVVGGSLTGTLALLTLREGRGRTLAAVLTEINSVAISLAITFGVAPLLFLQAVHGRLFYAATVLVAWGWLAMLALLTVAYYLNYVAKHAFQSGREPKGTLAVISLLFLAISATQVAVHLLSVQPSRWAGALASGWSVLGDPSFWPRFLHFVLAGVTMAGLLAAWLSVRKAPAPEEEADARARARFGIRVALAATVLQLLAGFWLTFSLPPPVLRSFMRGGPATMVPLTLGILAGFGLLLVLARITDPLPQRRLVRHAVELFGGAMIVMVVTRHQLREVYLGAEGIAGRSPEAPQWGVILLFLVTFALCLVLTVRAVVRAAKDRPAPGEKVA